MLVSRWCCREVNKFPCYDVSILTGLRKYKDLGFLEQDNRIIFWGRYIRLVSLREGAIENDIRSTGLSDGGSVILVKVCPDNSVCKITHPAP